MVMDAVLIARRLLGLREFRRRTDDGFVHAYKSANVMNGPVHIRPNIHARTDFILNSVQFVSMNFMDRRASLNMRAVAEGLFYGPHPGVFGCPAAGGQYRAAVSAHTQPHRSHEGHPPPSRLEFEHTARLQSTRVTAL